jgi:hypothetical protein
MSRTGIRRAAVILAALASALGVAVVPAQAGTAVVSTMKPLTVEQVPPAQLQAMIARGGGETLTFSGVTAMDITCYLAIGDPYGGGAPDADVAVDALVYCDNWVDAASLQIQLYRSNSLVASDMATFPYTYGVYGTVGIPDCVAGSYFGVTTAVVARYDHYPPVISASKRSADVSIGCGTPAGPPVGPNPPDCENNPRLCVRSDG